MDARNSAETGLGSFESTGTPIYALPAVGSHLFGHCFAVESCCMADGNIRTKSPNHRPSRHHPRRHRQQLNRWSNADFYDRHEAEHRAG